ncbi:hypothetical protein EHQ53_10050 [Leptospira langatensis]|uniref:Uncharacterized protein n=1 Tax=Leptospira langatensis TaxID=2484983 RepID=A0A5F1ZV66_9LEPT|nr:hypothetical protein [Leptospira langatensis]TGK00224.1 hypothetical protein EHO57_13140 [Leptospira langatensis]TGL41142.1 hypothetical protein EHQ53_10050 [Leptospira langatensis]
MIFLSLFRKLAVFLLFLLLFDCASPKKQIGEPELKLVLEYLTEARFAGRLNYTGEQKIRSDLEIVAAACERYQLDQDSVMEQIRIKHPEIYSALVGKK